MKNQLLALVLVTVASPMAFANHIGPAGCGLGNAIFKKENQVLAATTNGSFYNQLFGITSGTLGCADTHGGTAQMVMFVESNRIALSNEASRGKGETVEALANMMGCADATSVGHVLKSNFGEIFEANGDNSIAITNSIRGAVSRDEKVARSCQRLG